VSMPDNNDGPLWGVEAVAADQSYTIAEFCAAERISRALLYKLWEAGKGPRCFYINTSRRISHQARTEWRERLEAEAADVATIVHFNGGGA
jgi:hypothetical protein